MAPPIPSSSTSLPWHTRKPDKVVGSFSIENEIGKGSFATVYSGRHKITGAIVAIKSVNLSKLNRKLKENLYTEIEILKGLHHPHIVALIDCCESATQIHLVMEYCELGDLSYFIKKRDKLGDHEALRDMARKYPAPTIGGLPEVIVRHFLKQLASAVGFLRARNFIHRDVKPQNLLILPSPECLASTRGKSLIMMKGSSTSLVPTVGLISLPMLKIADFGFARSLPSTSLAETLCGSPLYMAPEILRYEKYDAKADLWSVGAVLFEMVTGKPPFRATNHVELLRRIEQSEDQIRFPKEVVISSAMKELIKALLKRNPTSRMSFENFFAHPVIVDAIPDLASEDHQKEISPSVKSPDIYFPPAPPKPKSRPFHNLSLPSHLSSPKERARPCDMEENESHQLLPSDNRMSEAIAEAEQAVRDAREYVLVEKRAVEVNSFADEMAAHPVLRTTKQPPVPRSGVMARRATTQGVPLSTTVTVMPSNSRTAHLSTGRPRPETSPRQNSFGRSYGSPSVTSTISRALNSASLRVFGVSYPDVNMKSASPPHLYNLNTNYAYPTPPSTFCVLGDPRLSRVLDEDQKFLNEIEESATRSDVVFGFAEVKYKQLIPLAPSNNHGINDIINTHNETLSYEDEGLTIEAIVTLSEEALVLYIKALSLLAKSMDIAKIWWSRKTRSDVNAMYGYNRLEPSSNTNAGSRINLAVQWVRNRFNEVFEKAELVSLKLLDAQKQLPKDNPAQLNPTPIDPPSVNGNVIITSGVTAEKLMYDRAIDMSRSAAISELANEDIDGCERSYITAIRMLEAVLENDEESSTSTKTSLGTLTTDIAERQDNHLNGIGLADRQAVLKVISMIKNRLSNLHKKRNLIAKSSLPPP
ncbi:Serine/threonine-protein kinase [Podosphaera aphanis]|nr:Serine/threonine-protein kinase [Podosphaera aphanis]